jgi:hypothetical protein
MRAATVLAAFLLALAAGADEVSDLRAAQDKWKSLGVQSYSYIFQWHGAVVVAPPCAGAKIRVQVKAGISAAPVVIKGTSKCPAGTKGEKAIGLSIPLRVEDAFSEMKRYIETPPVRARITARFDEQTGVPLEYYVEKLDISDNDEGFLISDLRIRK